MADNVTPEAVAKALEGVTPGPWLYRPDKHDDWGWVKAQDCVIAQVRHPDRIMDDELNEWRKAKQDPWEANARFVAWARNSVEALAADRDAQRARADAAEAKVTALEAEREKDHTEINLKADFIDATLDQFADTVTKLARVVEALDKINVGEGWAAQIARAAIAEVQG